MKTVCVKCGKDLTNEDVYFDSHLRRRKLEILKAKGLTEDDTTYGWCRDCYEAEISKIEIENLDEIAMGIAKFITRYHQYLQIHDYTFREAYNRSFYLEHIEISEDLILSIKEKIKLDWMFPSEVYSNPQLKMCEEWVR